VVEPVAQGAGKSYKNAKLGLERRVLEARIKLGIYGMRSSHLRLGDRRPFLPVARFSGFGGRFLCGDGDGRDARCGRRRAGTQMTLAKFLKEEFPGVFLRSLRPFFFAAPSTKPFAT